MPASLHRLWLVHLGLLLAAAVSLGTPFLEVDYRSPNIEYQLSDTFLGGGRGSSGGDSDAPKSFPSYQESYRLLEQISSPMGFAPVVQIAFVITCLSLMRRREGAVLGVTGSAVGVLAVLAIRLAIAGEAARASEVLGDRLQVILGVGTVLVPLAFVGILGWSIVRLGVGSQEGVARHHLPATEAAVSEPPAVLRTVGWYLVAMGALGLLSMATSDVEGSQTSWRALMGALIMVAGFGLIAAKRWAYAIAVVLGILNTATVLLVLMVSSTSGGASRLFVPFAFLSLLFVAPFIFLMRRDCRAWFSKKDRIPEHAGPRV